MGESENVNAAKNAEKAGVGGRAAFHPTKNVEAARADWPFRSSAWGKTEWALSNDYLISLSTPGALRWRPQP